MVVTPAIGTALWAGPLPSHHVRNVGSSELRIIAVELKN